jgi:hypothetical protein
MAKPKEKRGPGRPQKGAKPWPDPKEEGSWPTPKGTKSWPAQKKRAKPRLDPRKWVLPASKKWASTGPKGNWVEARPKKK